MSHRQITAPSSLLVTSREAMGHLRLEDCGDEEDLNRLIARATRHCENICQRAFVTQTWKLTLDGFFDRRYAPNGCIYVPRPRLIAVTAVEYLDGNGDSQTLDSSTYRVDPNSEPGRIEPAFGYSWPTTQGVIGEVSITHTCGYGDPSAVPDDCKHAVLLLVGHWNENREAGVGAAVAKQVESAILNLLDPYRMEVYA